MNEDKSPQAVQPASVTVRRKPVLRTMLRPRGGRKIPMELRAEPVYNAASAMDDGLGSPHWAELVARVDDSAFHADTKVRLYTRGVEAFRDITIAIDQACEEILVEAYIIRDDRTGHAILEALSRAVARGVEVKLLADAFGSSGTRREFWEQLRLAGTRVKLFRRPRFMPSRLQPILDHRKLVIVDRRLGFTGGMNIADEYQYGRMGQAPWRDTHIRVCGQVVEEMALIFMEGWEAAGGDPVHRVAPERPDSPSTGEGAQAGMPALLLDSRPGRGQSEVFSVFAAVLGAARQRVWISNAYFAPNRLMVELLIRTAKKGCDVRLLLPRYYDLAFFRHIARGYYGSLLEAGVRIYQYQPAVMHAKTLVADDCISIIGSTNFDFRSFDFNAECNLLFNSVDISQEMAEVFQGDLEQSEEITPERWLAWPWWQRGLWRLSRVLAPLF